MEFNAGDRLLLWCAPHRVRVDRLFSRQISVVWPWGTADPQSRFTWTGGMVVPSDPSSNEWFRSPWRLAPRTGLTVGDHCEVSIPATEVVVLSVHEFDPPLDTGWLPRPHGAVVMAMIDSPEGEGEADFTLYFDLREPIEISRIDD